VQKEASLVSHRYDRLPLLPSGPGGVQQELVVPDLWLQKYKKKSTRQGSCYYFKSVSCLSLLFEKNKATKHLKF
jgi:hypothetical protein